MADQTDEFYEGDAIHGYGAQWLIGNGADPGETFQAVAEVVSITPGDMTTAVLEKTHLRSPAAHREKKLGLRDSGAFSFVLNWRPQDESQSNAGGGAGSFTAGGIMALWRTRAERNMQIMVPDGSPAMAWPFRGGITKCQPGEISNEGIIPLMVEVTPLTDFSADLP
jgi:hypothetical protein